MALVVGVDVGTRYVTGVVFSGAAKSLRMIDYFREEIPAPKRLDPTAELDLEETAPPATAEDIVERVLRSRGLLGADVVTAVEAKDCIIREIPISFTKDEQIAKVIQFEAENFLPTMDLEDILLEYLKVGEAGGKSQVILFGLRQDRVATKLEKLKALQIDPVALDVDAAALFNAFAMTPMYKSSPNTLLIDMGATSTKIVLVEDGRLKRIRAFRTSTASVLSPDRLLVQPSGAALGAPGEASASPEGDSIESRFQEIENALKRLDRRAFDDLLTELGDLDAEAPIALLSDEDYERVQRAASEAAATEPEAAPPAGRRPAADRASLGGAEDASPEFDGKAYLTRLAVEIQRTMAACTTPVSLICVTGGMSRGVDVCKSFSEDFDVEVIPLDFGSAGESFASDLDANVMEEVSQYGAVAVGLALKELGHDLTGLDFRKGPFRYEHRFSKLKFPLLVASLLCFALFLQTAFWAYHEHERLKNIVSSHEAHIAKAFATFFEKPAPDGMRPIQAAQGQRKIWQGKGVGEVGKYLPAIDVLRNVADLMEGLSDQDHVEYFIKLMKFNFAATVAPGPGNKPTLRTSDSSMEILTRDDSQVSAGANQRVMARFREGLSKFFDARASSNAAAKQFKITVTLSPKPSVISLLE